MSKSHLPLEERFWRRVHKTRACWLWLGAVDKHGYGSFYDYARKHNQLAHRISYELKHGSVLSNVVLSHLCENPSCVRPSHLKPMSHGDNLRYSVAQRGNLHLPSVNRTDPQRLKKLKAANDTKLKAQLVPENRIWRYINKTETCWLWTGHTDRYGYARLTINIASVLVHRYVYELFKGPISAGLLVCHACDTPHCVNPDHLFLGTCQDNSTDMRQKNRHVPSNKNFFHTHPEIARGENNTKAKLTWDQIHEIRQKYHEQEGKRGTISALMSEYNVCRRTISNIVKNKRWNIMYAPPPEPA